MKRICLLLLLALFCLQGHAQKTTRLKEVVVKPSVKKVVLGTRQQKADYGFGGSKEYPLFQTGYYIPAEGVAGFIDRIGLYIYHKHTFLEFISPAKEVLLYLYLPDSTGMPGKPLLPEPLLIKPKKNTYWHWVDVAQYNLPLPDKGIFAAVGWAKPTKGDTGPLVGMSNECKDCPFYIYRFMTEDNTWRRVEVSSQSQKEEEAFRQGLMVRLEVAMKEK
ncbi:hypothetical protein [Pontibacter akesuensis]|uniref:Uncharacterized protein n=1 Tax=Pontibacter akesuensis TaxID=388950 RepID=A0A1I7JBM8_9BACT|nr:hypothetical protein [Pontibacter akesuensis]GHA71145.1 hypothetical protein GCM10007389_25750 [Pontibacter akesuensis]SFU82617.1 hypothetical protein SAMN04487941_2690 [Pontibacter akesuensis]